MVKNNGRCLLKIGDALKQSVSCFFLCQAYLILSLNTRTNLIFQTRNYHYHNPIFFLYAKGATPYKTSKNEGSSILLRSILEARSSNVFAPVFAGFSFLYLRSFHSCICEVFCSCDCVIFIFISKKDVMFITRPLNTLNFLTEFTLFIKLYHLHHQYHL